MHVFTNESVFSFVAVLLVWTVHRLSSARFGGLRVFSRLQHEKISLKSNKAHIVNCFTPQYLN